MSSYTGIVMVLFALMMISFFLVKASKFFLYIALASMAGFVVMFFVIGRKQKKNEQEVKNIKGDFIRKNYPELTFDPDNSISSEEFISLGIEDLPQRTYNFKSGGLVSGNANGIPFRASSIRITHRQHHSGNSNDETITDYEGVVAIFNTSELSENKIMLMGAPLIVGEKPVEVPEFVRKIGALGMRFKTNTNGLVSKDAENLFGKPVTIYSDNMDYAENFLTDSRILQLKEIPFSTIVIKGNQVALSLPDDVVRIVNEYTTGETKKITFVDYNADVDPEKVCRETEIILDIILSFPEKMELR